MKSPVSVGVDSLAAEDGAGLGPGLPPQPVVLVAVHVPENKAVHFPAKIRLYMFLLTWLYMYLYLQIRLYSTCTCCTYKQGCTCTCTFKQGCTCTYKQGCTTCTCTYKQGCTYTCKQDWTCTTCKLSACTFKHDYTFTVFSTRIQIRDPGTKGGQKVLKNYIY